MNQREIKFRAWLIKRKAMAGVYTLGLTGIEYTTVSVNKELLSGVGKEDMVLMQYTGLKDKNGVEIYEGDICKDDVGHFMEIKFGELPLDKGGDCVCTYQSFYAKDHGKLGETPYYECNQIENWFEVIGNIYENEDLISSLDTLTDKNI